MKFFIFTISLITSLHVFAATWSEDFEALKSVPRSYEESGAICEEIARLDMQKQYPAPQFKVEVGIAYGDAQRTIGELDIIVFDQGHVVLIGEVKCWKDFKDGLEKAHNQRTRFLKAIRSPKELIFKSTSTQEQFDQQAFEGVSNFITIGQLGARQAGYDMELGYTLLDLHHHTDDMLRCQHQGECARP